jgi:hypothetical protein
MREKERIGGNKWTHRGERERRRGRVNKKIKL